jgi:hypothetical protein
MNSQWITQITPDNLDFVVEYAARFGMLSREDITRYLALNANNDQESYLLVYNPENISSTERHLVDGQEVQERYSLIPVFHPEGHIQEFVNNH